MSCMYVQVHILRHFTVSMYTYFPKIPISAVDLGGGGEAGACGADGLKVSGKGCIGRHRDHHRDALEERLEQREQHSFLFVHC